MMTLLTGGRVLGRIGHKAKFQGLLEVEYGPPKDLIAKVVEEYKTLNPTMVG